MAKKDWKKHFLRMKQLANQNLGRYVTSVASFAETVSSCIGPAAEKRDESDAIDTMSSVLRMIKS